MRILRFFTALVVIGFSPLNFAMFDLKEAEKIVKANLISNFLDVANNQNLYIYERLIDFKQKNTDPFNPEGGLKLPLTVSSLDSFILSSDWDQEQYCMDNGECVIASYKQTLLIGIPTSTCRKNGCVEKKILYKIKGGIKTTCENKTSTNCVDSTIVFMPDEVDL